MTTERERAMKSLQACLESILDEFYKSHELAGRRLPLAFSYWFAPSPARPRRL
jgi:hypothetical protein